MQKWEYLEVQFNLSGKVSFINGKASGQYKGIFAANVGEPLLEDFLKKCGEEGWEMIAANGDYASGRLFFKRLIESQVKSPGDLAK